MRDFDSNGRLVLKEVFKLRESGFRFTQFPGASDRGFLVSCSVQCPQPGLPTHHAVGDEFAFTFRFLRIGNSSWTALQEFVREEAGRERVFVSILINIVQVAADSKARRIPADIRSQIEDCIAQEMTLLSDAAKERVAEHQSVLSAFGEVTGARVAERVGSEWRETAQYPLLLRWCDLDENGHVNQSVFKEAVLNVLAMSNEEFYHGKLAVRSMAARFPKEMSVFTAFGDGDSVDKNTVTCRLFQSVSDRNRYFGQVVQEGSVTFEALVDVCEAIVDKSHPIKSVPRSKL